MGKNRNRNIWLEKIIMIPPSNFYNFFFDGYSNFELYNSLSSFLKFCFIVNPPFSNFFELVQSAAYLVHDLKSGKTKDLCNLVHF